MIFVDAAPSCFAIHANLIIGDKNTMLLFPTLIMASVQADRNPHEQKEENIPPPAQTES